MSSRMAWPRRTLSTATDGHFSSAGPIGGTYREETLSSTVLKAFGAMRAGDELCDVTLEAGDVQIPAHRSLLAACSPYFHCMFTSGLRESRENRVQLQGIDSKVLSAMVDFFYTGTLPLHEMDLEETLRVASLFQLPGVREAAAEMIQRQLSPTNCLSVRAFAAVHGAMRLESAAEAYSRRHFQKVVRAREDFLALEADELERLLSCDELNVDNEERVYEAVMAWTQHDQEQRSCFLPRLLAKVRLPTLPANVLMDKVGSNDLVKNSRECVDLLLEATRFHLLGDIQGKAAPPPWRRQPRTPPANTKYALVAIGGRSRRELSKSAEMYDPETRVWQEVASMETARWATSAAVLYNELYVVGGSDNSSRLDSVEVFDPQQKKWCMIESMTTCRNGVGVAAVDNALYAVGGFDGSTPLKTAERYDPSTKTWQPIASMSEQRYGVGVAVCKGKIYVVGGGNGLDLASVEVYDPATSQWRSVASMRTPRKHVAVASLDGYVYAIGGCNNATRHSTVERYDPFEDKWTEVAPMSSPRSGAAVAAMDGYLFVAGGFDGHMYLTLVERYDPHTDMWTRLPAMGTGREGLGLAVVSLGKSILKAARRKST